MNFVKINYGLSPDAFGWIAEEAAPLGLELGGRIPLRMTRVDRLLLGAEWPFKSTGAARSLIGVPGNSAN